MDLKSFLLIADIQTALFAIGTTLSFLKFKARQYYIVLLGFTLLASVCGDVASFLLRGIANPNYGASVYNMVVFPLITAIYYNSVGNTHKRVFVFVSVAISLFAVMNVFFLQKSSINSYTLIVQSIIIICYSLYYFYWLIRELPTSQLHLLPMFWINSAYFIFFSGNLFLFVFTSYLVNVLNNNLLVYWTLHNVLGIIEGLMIIVALWMDLRNIRLLS